MKTTTSFLISFFFINFFSFGQNIDTIKYYNCQSRSFKSYNNSDSIVRSDYKINKRKVSSIRGEEIERCNCVLERSCGDTTKHIFFVKTYNLKEQLVWSGYQTDAGSIFWGPFKEYYKNGNVKTEGRYLFFGEDWLKYKNSRYYNIKTGTWTDYTKDGKVRKVESYFQNEKIK